MPRTNTYSTLTNREYWVTQDGRKLYPDQFESGHLVNTLKMLQRNARKHRLEQAKELCEITYSIGEGHIEPERYYQYFSKEMNMFMDTSISDIEWLKQNSKIFGLLEEEAKYRKLDYKETPMEEKVYYTGNGQSKMVARATGRPRSLNWNDLVSSQILSAT